jgi:hypothetical protein
MDQPHRLVPGEGLGNRVPRGAEGTGSEGLVGGWCVLVFRRDDGFERTVLLSPVEQTPAALQEIVKEAFRVVPRRMVPGDRLPPGVNQDRRTSPRR